MLRILGVLETALEGGEWLVGDKCTFADLAFFWWNEDVGSLLGPVRDRQDDGQAVMFEGFPDVRAWHEGMGRRRMCHKAAAKRRDLMGDYGRRGDGILGRDGVGSWGERYVDSGFGDAFSKMQMVVEGTEKRVSLLM